MSAEGFRVGQAKCMYTEMLADEIRKGMER